MPVEAFEIIKLILGLIIITIPGYLWSFYFSEKLSQTERIVFGFMTSLAILTCLTFLLNIFSGVRITQNLVTIIYLLYSIPVFILYIISAYKYGLPKINLKPFNIKYVWLILILAFVFFMTLLPHIVNNYYLPFHVDEWEHWQYTRGVIENGATSFPNPYTGKGSMAHPEIGFHISTACLKWISGTNLLTIFLFMPAIMGILMSLTVFNIGERSNRKFGLEAAFLMAFIPTTCRGLGPSFYVAVTMGLLILIFVIWLAQFKQIQSAMFISPFIFFMFIVHPVTAIAGAIILLTFSIFFIIEKKYKTAFWTIIFSVLPVILVYYFSTRWNIWIEYLLDSLQGEEYLANLPEIWITFEYFGIIGWALFIIGIYFSFTKGDSLKRTLSFSAIAFIAIIALYTQFSYGLPIIYDRIFLYLYVMIAIIGGVGLSEFRKNVGAVTKIPKLKKYFKKLKNIEVTIPLITCVIIIFIALPVHVDTGYYKLISEQDYETFVWIDENLDYYKDENHTYDRGAINPFKASPFSAITGLHIIASSMHPLQGEKIWGDMYSFLGNECRDTSFITRYKIGLIYGDCENSNLTMIYPDVYVYPSLKD